MPGAQSTQVEALLAPTSVDQVPSGHRVHSVLLSSPGLVLYVPAAQPVQVSMLVAPTALLQYPAVQSSHIVAFVALCHLPVSHQAHVLAFVAPIAVLYLPDEQASHAELALFSA